MRLSGPLRSDCNQVRRHAFPLSTILRWPVWVHGVRSREITQARSTDFLKCPSRLNPNIDVNTSGTARLWPSPESEFGKERVDLESYLADVLRGPQFHQQRVLRLIVVMLENRSFDNMCGWLYGGDRGTPKAFLPSGNNDPYEGLNNKLFNPVDPAYFDGKQVELYPVFPHADATDMPNPDPLK